MKGITKYYKYRYKMSYEYLDFVSKQCSSIEVRVDDV